MRFITRSYLIEQFQNFVDNVLCRYGKVKELTQAGYAALPPEKVDDGVIYFISDTGTLIRNGVEYTAAAGESKIIEIPGVTSGKQATFTSSAVIGSNANFAVSFYTGEPKTIKTKQIEENTLTVTFFNFLPHKKFCLFWLHTFRIYP